LVPAFAAVAATVRTTSRSETGGPPRLYGRHEYRTGAGCRKFPAALAGRYEVHQGSIGAEHLSRPLMLRGMGWIRGYFYYSKEARPMTSQGAVSLKRDAAAAVMKKAVELIRL
jgi:hypothetical protein